MSSVITDANNLLRHVSSLGPRAAYADDECLIQLLSKFVKSAKLNVAIVKKAKPARERLLQSALRRLKDNPNIDWPISTLDGFWYQGWRPHGGTPLSRIMDTYERCTMMMQYVPYVQRIALLLLEMAVMDIGKETQNVEVAAKAVAAQQGVDPKKFESMRYMALSFVKIMKHWHPGIILVIDNSKIWRDVSVEMIQKLRAHCKQFVPSVDENLPRLGQLLRKLFMEGYRLIYDKVLDERNVPHFIKDQCPDTSLIDQELSRAGTGDWVDPAPTSMDMQGPQQASLTGFGSICDPPGAQDLANEQNMLPWPELDNPFDNWDDPTMLMPSSLGI